MSVWDWSTTAATNSGSDAQINWAEGMLPSVVNNSARAMMAAVAAWLKDQGGGATSAGSSNAYTLTLTQTMASAIPGLVAFKANHTNTGAATLNVDGLGADDLRAATGVALTAGQIVSGCIYLATWVAGTSEWLLVNPSPWALPLIGGTLTGALTLSGAPTVDLHAATKVYVDDSNAVAVLQDQKADGTDGGTFTTGSWVTRTLNTEVFDTGSNITLASNEFTPNADGMVDWSAPAFDVDGHQTRLYNVTDAGVTAYGSTALSPAAGGVQTVSMGSAAVVSGKTYRIEHSCETTNSGDGLGTAATLGGIEVYTIVKYVKL